MFTGCESILIVNIRKSSRKIQRKHGLLQGSVLSPFLFNIFIDQLARNLNAESLDQCRILLFADDILLKSKTNRDLQRLLDICFNWSTTNGMSWGYAKCQIVCKQKPIDALYLGTTSLEHSQSYRYLGVPHKYDGIDWKLVIQNNIDKSANLLKHIESYFPNTSGDFSFNSTNRV